MNCEVVNQLGESSYLLCGLDNAIAAWTEPAFIHLSQLPVRSCSNGMHQGEDLAYRQRMRLKDLRPRIDFAHQGILGMPDMMRFVGDARTGKVKLLAPTLHSFGPVPDIAFCKEKIFET